jgi:16S rRNA (guanine966-N2)-methyltransferase
MRIQLRIVAGLLRGRKLNCQIDDAVRPTPQMVREALFSILGNAIPDRPFVDLFAGTGANGLEAISRGATVATFVERDVRLANEIERHAQTFQVGGKARVVRSDAYRWAERWLAPAEPVNVFVSPPFADFQNRSEAFLQLVEHLQQKLAVGSVLVVQGEKGLALGALPDAEQWEERRYGRNLLLIWVKQAASSPLAESESESSSSS